MDKLHKDLPTSYQLSPTARLVILSGHHLLNISRTSIVEQAVLEWGQRHLTKDLHLLHAFFAGTPVSSGGPPNAT